MPLTSFPHALVAIWVAIMALQRASAQSATPSNDTSSVNTTTQFGMDTILDMTTNNFPLLPLTPQAGLQGDLDQVETIKFQGALFLANTSSVDDLDDGNIAYLSCEPGDYANGAINASQMIDQVASSKPDAIVLYSVYAALCNLDPSGDVPYELIYTMISADASASVLAGLLKGNPATPNTTINVDASSFKGSGSGSGNDNGAGGNVLGKSPTTAVAMIILYSITGIITALFLAIIVVGAVRAHRHPERYGPRRVMGRPRQSRARGIARAMLETIPIVKFGDKEEDKPEETGRDIELANSSDAHGVAENQGVGEQSREHATSSADAFSGDGPDVVRTEAATDTAQLNRVASDPVSAAENGLACSVCTDDFVKGQDIRVLPCKHKFHPECIDPWLLNVSGTCPLCRIDLHPTTSHDADAEGVEYDDGPSLETREWRDGPHVDPENAQGESARRNRRSRILHTLNIGRMRHATPEERIEALRRLRTENQASDSFAEQGSGVGSRFSRRVSRAFGGSRGGSRRASEVVNSRPMSEVGPIPAEPATPTHAQTRFTVETAPHPTAETTSPTIAEPTSFHPTTGTPVAINDVAAPGPPAQTSFSSASGTAAPITSGGRTSNTNDDSDPATTSTLSPIPSVREEPPDSYLR